MKATRMGRLNTLHRPAEASVLQRFVTGVTGDSMSSERIWLSIVSAVFALLIVFAFVHGPILGN